MKFLTLSGPKRYTWFSLTTPDFTIPDKTNPTPSTTKLSLISNSKGSFYSSSRVGVLTFSFEMKSTSISKPVLETLETGKIGQIVPLGIISTVFYNSFFDTFSSITTGNLFKSLFFKIFLISPIVYSYLFSGARSILVKMTKKGIFKNRHNPICYLVIFWRPMFAPTTTQPKSLK